MSIVKICGIRDAELALVAAESGADYLGFMFAPSQRQVSAGVVAGIMERVREAGHATQAVGVFVDPTLDDLLDTIAVSGIDLVQLSGDESPRLAEELPVEVIKAIPAGAQDEATEIIRRASEWSSARHVMLDANEATARGGTGKRANWELAATLTRHIPVILAGGLDPEHVAGAIAKVRPMGVDVSSGVETDGRKDSKKIRRFIDNAKDAFARQGCD